MKRNRRGISLAEMLVVMTAFTVAFSLSGQLLTRVFRIYCRSQDHADVERSALRLSTQFRRDVHQADTAITETSATDDGVFLRLSMSDGSQLDYSYRGGAIVRQRTGDGELAAREEFKFPEILDVVVQRLGRPSRLELTLTAVRTLAYANPEEPAVRVSRNPINVHVETVLGRDRRVADPANDREVRE
jgi:hypothetical protein